MRPDRTAPGPDAAAPLRARLRAALPTALKARDAPAVSALRSALAAIDNAEAVDAPTPPTVVDHPDVAGSVGLGAGEAPRRELTAEQLADIVAAEIAERETAALDYDRLGHPGQAARLRAEAATLRQVTGADPVIDTALVRRLVADQFPAWADLPVAPVEFDGWDNRTFRLGDAMAVRLPSGAGYAAQVGKEQRWLPVLAPQLPLPIPVPLAQGRPAEGYPFAWSILRWLHGEPASVARTGDLRAFAEALAGFLTALQRIDPAGGPPAGPHSAHRGAPLTTYDEETRRAIESLDGEVPAADATAVWEAALAATWDGPPVWFHGDVSAGNLLVRDGRLAAVIDFGCSGVGDPACDVTIAWTFFEGDARAAFRGALPADPATWARGRGWALWKALITLVAHRDGDPAAAARRVIRDVLTDHEHARPGSPPSPRDDLRQRGDRR